VTPENQLAELALRGSSVLPQDFRGPQMGCSVRPSVGAQTAVHKPAIRQTPEFTATDLAADFIEL